MDTNWEQCLTSFLRGLEVRSRDTRIGYGGILRRFLAGKDPGSVTRTDVEDFIHSRSEKPRHDNPDGSPSVATINKRLSAISSFFKYASTFVPHGETEPLYQRVNPATGIMRGKPERSYRTLSYEEFSKFFDAIPRDTLMGLRDRAIFLLFFWSARRRSEIAFIAWGNIERAMIIEADGTHRMGWVYHFRGKRKKSEDDVAELPEYAMLAIQKYLEADGRWGKMQTNSPLFLAIGRGEEGGNVRPGEQRILSIRGIIKRLEFYAHEAGIAHFSLHAFRHTSARMRREAGMRIEDIHELLRHSSLDQTYRYIQSMVGTADSGAKLLEEKFGRFS